MMASIRSRILILLSARDRANGCGSVKPTLSAGRRTCARRRRFQRGWAGVLVIGDPVAADPRRKAKESSRSRVLLLDAEGRMR